MIGLLRAREAQRANSDKAFRGKLYTPLSVARIRGNDGQDGRPLYITLGQEVYDVTSCVNPLLLFPCIKHKILLKLTGCSTRAQTFPSPTTLSGRS